MERDLNPMPKIELFPRLAAVGRFVGRLLTPAPHEAPLFMSEHYRPENHSAAAMLDTVLYEQQTIEFPKAE